MLSVKHNVEVCEAGDIGKWRHPIEDDYRITERKEHDRSLKISRHLRRDPPMPVQPRLTLDHVMLGFHEERLRLHKYYPAAEALSKYPHHPIR